MPSSRRSKGRKDRGRSKSKRDRRGAKDQKGKSKDKDRKRKDKKAKSSSYSRSRSASSEDPALDAEIKVSEAVAASFGIKPKMLKFTKHIVRMQDLSPYLLACALCRATTDLTEGTLMRLGGELFEAGVGLGLNM